GRPAKQRGPILPAGAGTRSGGNRRRILCRLPVRVGQGLRRYRPWRGRVMTDTLVGGTILDIPQPLIYRVRLNDAREVLAQPSRLHFGNRPQDLERIEALEPGAVVTVRVTFEDPAHGWLVRVAMPQEERQTRGEPPAVLEAVRDAAAERKLRLFACACCRGTWDLIPEGPHRLLVGMIEAYADGRADAAELEAAVAAGDEEEQRFSEGAHDAEHDPVAGWGH